jgi:hypothetical protein
MQLNSSVDTLGVLLYTPCVLGLSLSALLMNVVYFLFIRVVSLCAFNEFELLIKKN